MLLADGQLVLGNIIGANADNLEEQQEQTRANINDGIENLEQKIQDFQASALANQPALLEEDENTAFEPIPPDYNTNRYSTDLLKGKLEKVEPKLIDNPPMSDSGELLVLKIEFEDIPCIFTDTEWHNRIFGDGTSNSVSDYYTKQSNGTFTYVPAHESAGIADDGVITVKLPINRPLFSAAGRNTGNGQNFDRGAQTGIYPAQDGSEDKYAIYNDGSIFAYGLNAADASIDFAAYDKNEDGYVSPTELAILVVAAGYEAAMSEHPEGKQATWAHSWYANDLFYEKGNYDDYLGYYVSVSLDNKKMYKYTVIGENMEMGYDYQNPDLKSAIQAQIGTPCHELGHDLGLMDLYDTRGTKQTSTVGYLSLMAGGNWGSEGGDNQPGSSPTNLDPYSKIFLGFYDSSTITKTGNYAVLDSSKPADYNILRVNTENPDIYFLIENRIINGYDKGMRDAFGFSTDGGIVFWRINEEVVKNKWDENSINNEAGNYGIMPEYLSYSDYFDNMPFRNAVTCRPLDEFIVTENPRITLRSFDETGTSMDVWLNVQEGQPVIRIEGRTEENTTSEPKKAVNTDALTGSYLEPQTGKTITSSLIKQEQGPIATLLLEQAVPQTYKKAFSFNLEVNHKLTYDKKTNQLTMYVPLDLQKKGRTFALVGINQKGVTKLFYDIDTREDTITVSLDIEGFAFWLIYTDDVQPSLNSAAQKITLTSGSGRFYTVRQGDTLSAIAKNLKQSRNSLIKKNNLENPNKLSIGQKLYY